MNPEVIRLSESQLPALLAAIKREEARLAPPYDIDWLGFVALELRLEDGERSFRDRWNEDFIRHALGLEPANPG